MSAHWPNEKSTWMRGAEDTTTTPEVVVDETALETEPEGGNRNEGLSKFWGGAQAESGSETPKKLQALYVFVLPKQAQASSPVIVQGVMMSSSGPISTCVARTLTGAIHGATFGLLFSLLTTGIDSTVWMGGSSNPNLMPTASGLLRMAGSRAGRNVKAFALFSALFNGLHCSVEKARGRRDWINAATTGAILGYTWGARQGPRAGIVNAATLATFCGLYDAIWGRVG